MVKYFKEDDKMKRSAKNICSLIMSTLILFSTVLYFFENKAFADQSRIDNFSKSYNLSKNPAQNMINIALAQQDKTGSLLGYTEEWCADFVSDCAVLAGQSSAIPHDGYCPTLKQKIINAGGKDVTSSPQPGDIVFFNGHVEIVYSGTLNALYSIGGNTGSGSSLYARKVCAPRIHGGVVCVLRPNYDENAVPLTFQNDDELKIPYPRPTGNPNLQNGSSGDSVKWLQYALNLVNNAGLKVDGQFGSGTQQAVVNFQRTNGLTADGIAGPATISKIVEVRKKQLGSSTNTDTELGIPYPRPTGNPNLQNGSSGDSVKWLQYALNLVNNAGLTVDGQFGSGTKQAVINFQRAYGLDVDGIAGPATINKIVAVRKSQLN